MNNDLVKKAIAEIFGTFVLVFFACGTAAYTKGDPVATSLAFGLVIVAMAYTIGRISGCHINPAVSLGCLITKRMTLKEFLVYVCAQLIGAVFGAIIIFGLFSLDSNFAQSISSSTQIYNYGDATNTFIGGFKTSDGSINFLGMFGAIIAEIILTCIFVYVILNVTDKKANKEGLNKFAGIIIGLTLTLVHLVGIGLTGTSVNPARSFATAISQALYFESFDALVQLFVFIFAPFVGSAFAAILYIVLNSEDNKEINSEKNKEQVN